VGHLHEKQIRRQAGRGPIAKRRLLTEEKRAKAAKFREKFRRNTELKRKALLFTKEQILDFPDWSFSQRLKALRWHQGDRIADVAAGAGVTVSTIEKLEVNARRPGRETAKQLAQYFKVTLVRLTRGLDRFSGEY